MKKCRISWKIEKIHEKLQNFVKMRVNAGKCGKCGCGGASGCCSGASGCSSGPGSVPGGVARGTTSQRHRTTPITPGTYPPVPQCPYWPCTRVPQCVSVVISSSPGSFNVWHIEVHLFWFYEPLKLMKKRQNRLNSVFFIPTLSNLNQQNGQKWLFSLFFCVFSQKVSKSV